MVGESRRGRLSTALRPSTADIVVRDSGDIDVQVVTHDRAAGSLLGRSVRRNLTGKRKLVGVGAAVLVPVLVTCALLPFHTQNDPEISLVLLAMLTGVVACSLVGGMLAAVIASLSATVLTNYWFIPPEKTFMIAQHENAVALVMFVFVGCTIAAIVDRSTALATETALRRAEVEALDVLSRAVLQRTDNLVRGLLELACSTFSMRCAVLFERRDDAQGPSVLESVGQDPPNRPEDADVAIDSGQGLTLAASGRALTNSERRILAAYATQARALVERDRLGARAADAARLREGEQARRALLAAVSHDLRTPIAGIKVSISTLADEQLDLLPEDRRALLESAERGTDRLNSLVSNLLDMSRLQTGSVTPLLRPVILDEVVQHAIAGMPGTEVVAEIGEDLPVIETDPVLLERVLANIIENAARQDSAGRPVRVSAGAVGSPPGHIDIRIVDQGPGVSPDQRVSMFEPFRRTGDQKQASEGGSGLGLAVANGLTDLLGARIEVEDTPGGGLTMVVSVPVKLNGQPSPGHPAPSGLLP